jgi:hypothetical protein
MSNVDNRPPQSKTARVDATAAFKNHDRRFRTQRVSPNRRAPPLGYLACRYFLRQLAPAGPWVLTAIDPDDRTLITTSTFTRLKDAREFIEQHNAAGMGVYYSINPCKTAVQSKASKLDIARVEYLHVDADPGKDELPEVFKARMLAAIAAFPHCPTFVIDSGNGLQLLFRLSVAVEITDAAVIADIEARNHALAVAFGAAPVTRDISRVFRLPWTWNYPNEPKRKLGRQICKSHLVGYMANNAYALEAFPPHVPSSESAAAHGAGGETSELPARVRTLLLHNDGGAGAKCGGYETRSHLMFAFLTDAIRARLADAAILDACVDAQYAGKGIFEHIAENGGRPYANGSCSTPTTRSCWGVASSKAWMTKPARWCAAASTSSSGATSSGCGIRSFRSA